MLIHWFTYVVSVRIVISVAHKIARLSKQTKKILFTWKASQRIFGFQTINKTKYFLFFWAEAPKFHYCKLEWKQHIPVEYLSRVCHHGFSIAYISENTDAMRLSEDHWMWDVFPAFCFIWFRSFEIEKKNDFHDEQ